MNIFVIASFHDDQGILAVGYAIHTTAAVNSIGHHGGDFDGSTCRGSFVGVTQMHIASNIVVGVFANSDIVDGSWVSAHGTLVTATIHGVDSTMQ